MDPRRGSSKMSGAYSDEEIRRSWNKYAFWLFLLWPFMLVLISGGLVEIFIGFLPEALVKYSYFCFLISLFLLSIASFHKCAFKYGPVVFGEKAISVAISCVDYLWYFFGGVVLSYFATGEFQDRYLKETMEDRIFIADSNQMILDGAFSILYHACRAFKESSSEDAAFERQHQSFVDFCDRRIATRDLSVGFEIECRTALASMEGLTRDDLIELQILRPVRGREINDLEFLCVNAKGYEEVVGEYRATGEKIGGWIGGVAP